MGPRRRRHPADPVNDLDQLLAPRRWDGKRCTVAQALADLDDKTRPKFEKACDDPRVPATNLITAFEQVLGESPASGAIRRHQNRHRPDVGDRCRCP